MDGRSYGSFGSFGSFGSMILPAAEIAAATEDALALLEEEE